MLRNEQFDPNQFLVVEYPATGVYCCNHVKGEKYFIIQEYEGKLAPYYTTWEMNEEGINNFPCKSIEESISANSLSGAISVYIISKERRKKKWLIQRLELLLKKAETISFL